MTLRVVSFLGLSLLGLLLTSCRPRETPIDSSQLKIDLTGRSPVFVDAYQVRLSAITASPAALHPLARLAQFFHANQYLTEARELYQVLRVREPRSARWPYLQSLVNQDLGLIDQAALGVADAVKRDPANPLLIYRQAELLRKSGQIDAARAQYARCLDQNSPYRAYALLGLATLDVRDEKWSTAETLLIASTQAETGMATAYKLLATVEEKLGQPARAQLARELALHFSRQRDPPDPWMDEVNGECFDVTRLSVLAGALLVGHRTTEAQALLRRVCEIDPQNARARLDLALTFTAGTRDSPERLALLREAIALDPEFSDAYYELALAESKRARLPTALAIIQTGLEHNARAAALYRLRGVVLASQKKFSDALSSFTQATTLNPVDPENHTAMGNLFWETGQRTAAVASYTRATELSILAVKPRAMLAAHAIEQEHYDQAIQWAQEARVIESDVEGLNELLSLAYLRQGNRAMRTQDWIAAESALKQALAVQPDSLEACNNLCSLYLNTNRPALAETLALAFIDQNPREPIAYKLLAIARLKLGRHDATVQALQQGLVLTQALNQPAQAAEFTEMLQRLQP